MSRIFGSYFADRKTDDEADGEIGIVSCPGTESTRLMNGRPADARNAEGGFASCAKRAWLEAPLRPGIYSWESNKMGVHRTFSTRICSLSGKNYRFKNGYHILKYAGLMRSKK